MELNGLRCRLSSGFGKEKHQQIRRKRSGWTCCHSGARHGRRCSAAVTPSTTSNKHGEVVTLLFWIHRPGVQTAEPGQSSEQECRRGPLTRTRTSTWTCRQTQLTPAPLRRKVSSFSLEVNTQLLHLQPTEELISLNLEYSGILIW